MNLIDQPIRSNGNEIMLHLNSHFYTDTPRALGFTTFTGNGETSAMRTFGLSTFKMRQ